MDGTGNVVGTAQSLGVEDQLSRMGLGRTNTQGKTIMRKLFTNTTVGRVATAKPRVPPFPHKGMHSPLLVELVDDLNEF